MLESFDLTPREKEMLVNRYRSFSELLSALFGDPGEPFRRALVGTRDTTASYSVDELSQAGKYVEMMVRSVQATGNDVPGLNDLLTNLMEELRARLSRGSIDKDASTALRATLLRLESL